MPIDAIKTVAVLGAGTMGNGIAHVFARAGYNVILRDVEQRYLDRAMDTVGRNLDREVKKGKLAEAEKPEVLARFRPVTDMAAIAAADFVVEAVPEKLEIKRAVLGEADKLLRPEVILASNTSSISMTALAALTQRPDRFVGMHFMNPVPVMTLVEVIRGTADVGRSADVTMELAKQMGKTPIEVNDYPGFISNRVLMPMINEAIFALIEGVATAEAIDARDEARHEPSDGPAHAGRFHRPGCVPGHSARAREGFGDPKYRPCPLLVKMVEAGWLGRKMRAGVLQLLDLSTARN